MAGLSRSWESVSCCPLRNQIAAGERLDVRCLSINSTNRDTWPGLMGPIRDDQVDALLVSPERFANDDFVMDVLLPIADRIGLLVVDEVHCISDWGHAMPGRRVSLHPMRIGSISSSGSCATSSRCWWATSALGVERSSSPFSI